MVYIAQPCWNSWSCCLKLVTITSLLSLNCFACMCAAGTYSCDSRGNWVSSEFGTRLPSCLPGIYHQRTNISRPEWFMNYSCVAVSSSLWPSISYSACSNEKDCRRSQCRAWPLPLAGSAQCGGSVPGSRGPLVWLWGPALWVLGPHSGPCPKVPSEGHHCHRCGTQPCQGIKRGTRRPLPDPEQRLLMLVLLNHNEV